MQSWAVFLILFGLGMPPITTPWPITTPFDLNPLCWFWICPDGETTTTEAPPVICTNGEFLLEDKNICVKFDATEESVMDLDEHCGAAEPDIEDDDYEHEKISNFLLVRTSDNESAIQTVHCDCKPDGLKQLVYDPETQQCATSFTQESCKEGEWLIPGMDGHYECVKNDCAITGYNAALDNGECVRLWEYCNDAGTKKFQINEDTGRVECMDVKIGPTSILSKGRGKPIPKRKGGSQKSRTRKEGAKSG